MIEKIFKQKITVTEEMSAANIGSGLLPVFSTPSMIAAMENTAMQLIPQNEGSSSVGTTIHADHLKASKIGEVIEFTAAITSIEGRKYSFFIEAFDSKGDLIGKAYHDRFVIDVERFMSKL